MLFDLQGKRRRVVQATYLTLAVLMGGGLVLFGVGSDVSGGIFDIFSGDDGGGSGNGQIEKRIEQDNETPEAQPARRGGAAGTWCAPTTSWPAARARRTRRASRRRPSRR